MGCRSHQPWPLLDPRFTCRVQRGPPNFWGSTRHQKHKPDTQEPKICVRAPERVRVNLGCPRVWCCLRAPPPGEKSQNSISDNFGVPRARFWPVWEGPGKFYPHFGPTKLAPVAGWLHLFLMRNLSQFDCCRISRYVRCLPRSCAGLPRQDRWTSPFAPGQKRSFVLHCAFMRAGSRAGSCAPCSRAAAWNAASAEGGG